MLSDSSVELINPGPADRPPGAPAGTDTCRGGDEHDVIDKSPLQQNRAR
jgi:hypothetical protein